MLRNHWTASIRIDGRHRPDYTPKKLQAAVAIYRQTGPEYDLLRVEWQEVRRMDVNNGRSFNSIRPICSQTALGKLSVEVARFSPTTQHICSPFA
jgi:hypothetical protein